MNINIGENIKKSRLEKGWTQEELAAYTGVSLQAVSKWERGVSYPDIELLPLIARSLNISIDELLSFDLDLTENEVKSLVEKAVDKYVEKGFEVGYKFVEDLFKKYPNSIALKFYLGSIFQNYIIDEEFSPEKIKSYYKRAVKIYEEVLDSGIGKYDYNTRLNLIGYYTMIDDLESAEALLNSLPEENQDKLLIKGNLYVLKGEKDQAKSFHQEYLKRISYNLLMTMNLLALGEVETDLSLAEEISQKSLDIAEILGVYKEFNLMSHIKIQLELNKRKEAIENYVKLSDLIKKYSGDLKSNLLFNKIETRGDIESTKAVIAKVLKYDPGFHEIKDDDRIKLADLELEKLI